MTLPFSIDLKWIRRVLACYNASMGACILQEGHSSGLELRYQATLSGDGTATPVLTKVQATFSGDNPTTEYDYTYDPAGNLTEVDTITAAGTATEVRDDPSWPAGDQINDLNQILRNDVTPAGGSMTTYRYTYNADGTLATKTDGTTTWTYNWDPVGTQRLLSVEADSVTQVAYTYDSLGRMLTRTPYSGGAAGAATSFEWDGMTVVRETTPGGVHRYYAPQGELITFDYTPTGGATASYSAHADAIGSIRAITDSTGALVAHFEYDAWGTLLPTSDFGPLLGWSYLFVGSLGVRWDGATGLYYMRQRWYDPGLERFVSRDPWISPLKRRGARSHHAMPRDMLYARNNPLRFNDPAGRQCGEGVLILGGVGLSVAEQVAAAFGLSLLGCLASPDCSAAVARALTSATEAACSVPSEPPPNECRAPSKTFAKFPPVGCILVDVGGKGGAIFRDCVYLCSGRGNPVRVIPQQEGLPCPRWLPNSIYGE